MSESLLSRWNLSKKRLIEVQEGLIPKKEDVRDRSAQLAQKSASVTHRLRDASLSTIYEFGSTTLSTAADLSDKVPVIRVGAEGMRQKAEALQVASQEVQRPPIAEYDGLNVKQVTEALEGLSFYDLEKVSRYEEAHKNRVTILREVERRVDAEKAN